MILRGRAAKASQGSNRKAGLAVRPLRKRRSKKKATPCGSRFTIISTSVLAFRPPAKSYLKVSSKLVVAFHVSSVVERRLISGTKVGRYPIKCQFASHVMEGTKAPEVMLLRNNHDNLQQKRSPGLRINDLPSFFQNRRQARYRKRV